MSCPQCGSDWSAGCHGGAACGVCGGGALVRPCVLCGGRCGRVWARDVAMTLSFGSAHFDGACALPQAEQELLLRRLLTAHATPSDLADDLADLMS